MDYSADAQPVGATLDRNANDGLSGEGDNVLPSISEVLGGSAGDVISAAKSNVDQPYRFYGRAGADHVVGGPNDDLLDGGGGADVVSGGNGRDDLRGDGGNDKLSGGDGVDGLDGGMGTDTCAGGAGADIFEHCESVS